MEYNIITYNLSIDSLPIIAICFLVAGFILNINKKVHCWTCWGISSILWLNYGLYTDQLSIAVQNLICIGFHVVGYITWSSPIGKVKKVKNGS